MSLILGVTAASSVSWAQQHLLSSFSLAEGLPQSQVWDITQDHKGFVWFATFGGGVARFDGLEFEVFTTDDGLASNSVYGVYEDNSGTIWLATRNGVSRRERDGFTTVSGIPEGVKVFDLTSDTEGRLWAATGRGAFVLEEGVFVEAGPTAQIQVKAIMSTTTGQLWLATTGQGVYRLDGGAWTQFTVEDGLPHNTVLSVGEGNGGKVWFGTEAGLARRDSIGFAVFTVADGLSSNRVHAIETDPEGNLWLGTDLGATQYDGHSFKPLSANTLSAIPVWSIAIDHEGNIYFGTSGQGALSHHHSPFTHLGEERFDGRTVWNVSSDPEGHFWFGLEGGLKRFDGETMAELPVQDDFLGDRSARALLHEDDGTLWVGTSRGVFRQRPAGGFEEVRGVGGVRVDDVRAIRPGRAGALWIATLGDGAFRWDGETMRPEPELEDRELYDVLETSNGNVWFVGGEGAAVRTAGGVRRLTVADGLNHLQVVAAVEDRFGRVWLGSYGGGLNAIDQPVVFGNPPRFESITTSDGLTDDTVLFLALDGRDGLWVGTNRGLNRIDIAAYESDGVAAIQQFGRFEGFVGVEANLHGAYRDPTGAMWFGHVEGVSRLASGSASLPPPPVPVVQLKAVRLFLERTNWSEMGVGEVAPSGLPLDLQLPYDGNHLTFDYIGLSFRAAERVVYRHRLEGFDETWSPAHGQRSVTYPNLGPGSYVFRVQASLDGLKWSSSQSGFFFQINEPFWQEWWFVLVSALGGLAALMGTYSYRTRTLRQRQRRLESVVAERTVDLTKAREDALQAARAKGQFLANMSHEIRTPMNGVLGFARLLAETDLDGEQQEFVEVINASGDSLLAIINDILDFSKMEAGKALLDTNPFSMRRLVERVLDLMSATAREKGIELIGQIDPEMPESVVGDEPKLQQILVNLVSNALKFTHSGEVVVEAWAVATDDVDVSVRLAVRDTGIGIPPHRIESLFAPFTQADASTTRKYGGTGLGLSISDRLCGLMGADLEVVSEEGVGSTFHFELRLPLEGALSTTTHRPERILVGKRVLVADSSVTTTGALADQLRFWGAEVIGTQSWPTAEALIRDGEYFDLVLVDMSMPELAGQPPGAFSLPHLEGSPRPEFIGLRSIGPGLDRSGLANGLAKPVKRAALLSAVTTVFTKESADVATVEAIEAPVPLHILVAEDNAINRKLIGRILERMGHRVEMVENGEEAVRAADAGSFDAVLMDIQMPVLDGIGAARRIRDEIPAHRRPRVIALTAATQTEDRERCRSVGMELVLHKPIGIARLKAALAGIRSEGSDRVKARPSLKPDRSAEERARRGKGSGRAASSDRSANEKTP